LGVNAYQRYKVTQVFVKENLKPLKRLDNMRAEQSPIYERAAQSTHSALGISR
jgi:hypothetical protein